MALANTPHPEERSKSASRRSRRRLAAAPHGEGTHHADPRWRLPSQQLRLFGFRRRRLGGTAATAARHCYLAIMEAERQRHLLMDRGGAGHRLALGVEDHGIAAAQHVLMRESVAVEPAAEIVEPLAALTQQALGGAIEAWGVVGQAPPRALDLDAQQIGTHPLGEAGDAATLEGEEMLEGAACPLCRIGKGTLLLADLLAG